MANHARSHLGYLGLDQDSYSWKRELSTFLGHGSAEIIIDRVEREEARENKRLDYDYHNMNRYDLKSYRAEMKTTLEAISEKEVNLEMFHVKGESFYEYKGKKEERTECDIYRLQAPDGYCLDYELDQTTNADEEEIQAAHVKFIMQLDTEKQGNGARMNRHVEECADVLFGTGLVYLWGLAARMNQFDVRETRHGDNWREETCRIRDAHGNDSPRMIRLLAMYLRYNWILFDYQKNDDELIAYFSPKGMEFMVEKCGNDSLEQYKYSKDYEKIITRYKI